jgi:hypothetical protein
MTIAFSICSYNYAALAFALYQSLKEHNPEIRFFLALVDSGENYLRLKEKGPEGLTVIRVNENVVEGYADLEKRYNIVELNTAVKPFIFEYLFSRYPDCKQILYLDPDIQVYHSFSEELLNWFNEYDIILTPHVLVSDLQDKLAIRERAFLNTGMFNLGFLGLKRCPTTDALLQWWKLRLTYWGYVNVFEGLFTDQIWINFVPLYYDKVLIFKHWGANVAHWNLWERKILKIKGKYFINDEKHPLLFYHFSAFTKFEDLNGELQPSPFLDYAYKLQDEAKEIIMDYQKKLVSLGHNEFFGKNGRVKIQKNTLMNALKKYFLTTLRKRGYDIVKTMKYYKIKRQV